MKKHLIAVVLGAVVCSATCTAQDSARVLNKNAVMFEAGGNGVIASLSYERIFYQKNNLRLCARAGCGILPHIGESNFHLEDHIFPFVEATLLYGKRKGYLEAGAGYTYAMEDQYYTVYSPSEGFQHYKYHNHLFFFRLGYRYQSHKGFMMRFAATPVIYFARSQWNNAEGNVGRYRMYPWIGLSFGKSF